MCKGMSSDPQVSPCTCRFSSSELSQALTPNRWAPIFSLQGLQKPLPPHRAPTVRIRAVFGVPFDREEHPQWSSGNLVVGKETYIAAIEREVAVVAQRKTLTRWYE